MSRNVPPALAAHLKQPATTICFLLKIMPKRSGVATFGLTTLDADRTYDDGTGALTYRAKRGYTAFDLDTRSDLSVDSSEASGLLAEYPADGVTAEGIARGDYDGARFVQYLVNYEDLTMGHVILNAGQVGQVTMIDDLTCKLELRSLTQILKQNSIIELTSITCRAKFGDERCKMPLRPYPATVATVGLESDRSFTVVNTSGSLVFPASVEKFLTAVGGEASAALTYGGLPLEGAPTVTAIHRTDWQGRQLLYPAARTNYCKYSDTLSNAIWYGNTSRTLTSTLFAGNVPYYEIKKTTTSGSESLAQASTGKAVAVGDIVTMTIAMRAGTNTSQSVGILSVADTWGPNANATAAILSGPGSLAQNSGGLWTVAGLSASQDTLLQITRTIVVAATAVNPYIYPGTPGSLTIGDSGLFTRIMLTVNGGAQGAYIPTGASAVTVTDYTLTGPSVALGQAATAGAAYDWDGSVSLPTTDGLFVPGVVHWTAGANTGRENEVESYVAATGAVTLVIPTYQTIAPGDTFTIRRDCDKSKAMCKAYGNLLNMRAEPELPRADGSDLQSPTKVG